LVSNVLVAVDGSENSIRGLDFALEFAEKYNANLSLINITESAAAAAYVGDSMVTVARDLRKYHEEILTKAATYAKNTHPTVQVNTILREGDPASEIISAATEGNFDVVVVGHRGLGKVKGMLLGSISDKVSRQLVCTVILVR
jgi:nucleotide-binding universal stress UspA family protein